MKFKIHVKNEKSDWWETYVKNIDDPAKYGEEIIAKFNATLRPGEKPRTFIAAEIIDDKVMEPVTEEKENDELDAMCEECTALLTTDEWEMFDGLCEDCANESF